MMEEKTKQYNDMLNLIYKITSNITDNVFLEYSKQKNKNLKPIYNLFAESFLSIKSYCLLMFNKAWAQAGAILRIAIEQISTLYVLELERQDLILEYLKLLKMKADFWCLEDQKQRNEFLKNHNIKKKEDFDYSWFKNGEGKSGSRQIIRAAHLEEVEIDIDNELNQFSHGKLSIFDFCNEKEKWGLMTRFGFRMNAICFRLFNYLCCAYINRVGNYNLSEHLNQQFAYFFDTYRHF